jgi:hypothetical protein
METIEKIIELALDFEKRSMAKMSISDRVSASKEGKSIVLSINEFYKKSKDPYLMDLMKLITLKKKKIDKKLKLSYT